MPLFSEWLLLSWVQTKTKGNLTHVPFLSDLSPVPTGENWSGHRRLVVLAATQMDPGGKSKYKCRTWEQGSFLERECLCRSILLASCPIWDLVFLQWILGLWVCLACSYRGHCTRGSATALRQTNPKILLNPNFRESLLQGANSRFYWVLTCCSRLVQLHTF